MGRGKNENEDADDVCGILYHFDRRFSHCDLRPLRFTF
jgi:hypothetical protein